jgi:hypothetical protein
VKRAAGFHKARRFVLGKDMKRTGKIGEFRNMPRLANDLNIYSGKDSFNAAEAHLFDVRTRVALLR